MLRSPEQPQQEHQVPPIPQPSPRPWQDEMDRITFLIPWLRNHPTFRVIGDQQTLQKQPSLGSAVAHAACKTQHNIHQTVRREDYSALSSQASSRILLIYPSQPSHRSTTNDICMFHGTCRVNSDLVILAADVTDQVGNCNTGSGAKQDILNQLLRQSGGYKQNLVKQEMDTWRTMHPWTVPIADL